MTPQFPSQILLSIFIFQDWNQENLDEKNYQLLPKKVRKIFESSFHTLKYTRDWHLLQDDF